MAVLLRGRSHLGMGVRCARSTVGARAGFAFQGALSCALPGSPLPLDQWRRAVRHILPGVLRFDSPSLDGPNGHTAHVNI